MPMCRVKKRGSAFNCLYLITVPSVPSDFHDILSQTIYRIDGYARSE
jgi:hypothetical protein